MPTLKLAAIAALLFALGGCQNMPSLPLSAQRIVTEHTPNGCQGEQCPLVNIDTLNFADQPTLNALIERRLLEMTRHSPDEPLAPSLQAYELNFLANAQPGWSSYLQAKIREQHDDLVIIELSSYLFTGGAHGMPGRGFINYDRKLEKALSLQDMLLPGQEAAFWQLAEQAHQRWLVVEQLDQDAEYRKNWPLEQTRNVALTADAVLLKYDVYSIAPYSSGHPELRIPYAQLKGVLKPEYFPGRG
jgi:hypothetical protein